MIEPKNAVLMRIRLWIIECGRSRICDRSTAIGSAQEAYPVLPVTACVGRVMVTMLVLALVVTEMLSPPLMVSVPPARV